jgi:hypothetical protein
MNNLGEGEAFWKRFRKSNLATRYGALVMTVGFSAAAIGGMADQITIQVDNHPSIEHKHDHALELFFGGLTTVLKGLLC